MGIGTAFFSNTSLPGQWGSCLDDMTTCFEYQPLCKVRADEDGICSHWSACLAGAAAKLNRPPSAILNTNCGAGLFASGYRLLLVRAQLSGLGSMTALWCSAGTWTIAGKNGVPSTWCGTTHSKSRTSLATRCDLTPSEGGGDHDASFEEMMPTIVIPGRWRTLHIARQ